MRRALPLFVDRTSQPGLENFVIGNCAPECFFLSDDGLCDIHAREGHGAKPETCRLFPFNGFRRVGRYLLVEPHRSLCPLQVLACGNTSLCSDYETLMSAMTSQGIAAPIPECHTYAADADNVIAEERAIVSASERFPREGAYIDWLVIQGRLSSAGLDETEERLRLVRTCVLMSNLLDVPGDPVASGDSELLHTMVAMTPFLRAQYAFSPRDPNVSLTHPLPRRRIPDAMACLFIVARAARAAGMRHVTFQSISKLEADFRQLVMLLARIDDVLVWRKEAAIDFGAVSRPQEQQGYLRVAKALLPTLQRRHSRSLGEILCEYLPANGLNRVLLLKRLAPLLNGNLVSLSDEVREPMWPTPRHTLTPGRRLRGYLRRWALQNVPENRLIAAGAADSLEQRPYPS